MASCEFDCIFVPCVPCEESLEALLTGYTCTVAGVGAYESAIGCKTRETLQNFGIFLMNFALEQKNMPFA